MSTVLPEGKLFANQRISGQEHPDPSQKAKTKHALNPRTPDRRSGHVEDILLEKLSIYLRHLAPVIATSQLNHEIDLSTVDFDYIAQHKRDTTSGKLSGGVALEPAKESGTGDGPRS